MGGADPGAAMLTRLRIGSVGRDGDGQVSSADGTVAFVPLSLPGEVVDAELTGRRGLLRGVVAPSADRVSPPCTHFGMCGGCALQHWKSEPYLAWKRELLVSALRRAGFDHPPVADVRATPPGARRRIDLAVQRRGAAVVVGLHRSRDAVATGIDGCVVLHPALERLLVPLRATMRSLTALRRDGSVVLNLLDSGPDVLLRLDGSLTLGDRSALVRLAAAQNLPRISVAEGKAAPETVCQARPAEHRFGGVTVRPPPGAFMQVSVEGEAAIVKAVLAGLPTMLPRRARVADLYAGCGTLTLPLAGRALVTAMEGDAAAAGSLLAAANGAGFGGRVTVEHRDLVRRPVMARELAGFSAVVLDPPHGGAEVQTREIAASSVRRVVYVSCNPDTLGRDAGVLRAAGLDLLSATPVDQFLWSARLESVCAFGR